MHVDTTSSPKMAYTQYTRVGVPSNFFFFFFFITLQPRVE